MMRRCSWRSFPTVRSAHSRRRGWRPGGRISIAFEINGSKGSLVFNFEEMNVLQFYNCADPPGRQGFRQIMATEGVHPYVANWWPPGHVLGYEHTFVHAVYELMGAISKNRRSWPTSATGPNAWRCWMRSNNRLTKGNGRRWRRLSRGVSRKS